MHFTLYTIAVRIDFNYRKMLAKTVVKQLIGYFVASRSAGFFVSQIYMRLGDFLCNSWFVFACGRPL